jgi:hypothetical protein
MDPLYTLREEIEEVRKSRSEIVAEKRVKLEIAKSLRATVEKSNSEIAKQLIPYLEKLESNMTDLEREDQMMAVREKELLIILINETTRMNKENIMEKFPEDSEERRSLIKKAEDRESDLLLELDHPIDDEPTVYYHKLNEALLARKQYIRCIASA